MLAGMQAWNSDYHFLYVDINGTGPALRRGRATGQARDLDRARRRRPRARRGPRARLERAHERAPARGRARGRGRQTRASLGLPEAVIVDGRDPANYVVAPEDGIFEALLEPPAEVKAGDPVARLWFPDTPGRPPGGAARAARRRARRDPRDPGDRGRRRRLHDRPADRRGGRSPERHLQLHALPVRRRHAGRHAAGRDLRPLLGRRDARHRRGRPPAVRRHGRRVRAARRRRADAGARRGRPRLVPARARRAASCARRSWSAPGWTRRRC